MVEARPTTPPSAPRSVVHQCLFGYADGHRMLASSTALAASASRQLLIASDFPVFERIGEEGGHVTGSPIEGASFYAFSSTWPAPELPRPGCVWTHTLLIPFPMMSRINDLSVLLDMFRRPRPGFEASRYGQVLDLDASTEDFRQVDRTYVGSHEELALLRALYARPRDPVLVYASQHMTGDAANRLICRVWSQQWPRLRRTFRFTTRDFIDRLTVRSELDLQVGWTGKVGRVPPDRAGCSVVQLDSLVQDPNGVIQEDVRQGGCPWLDLGCADLAEPTDFRRFLKRYGADASEGRPAYAGLATLYLALMYGSVEASARGFGSAVARWFAASQEVATLKADVLTGKLKFPGNGGISQPHMGKWLLSMLTSAPNLSVCFEHGMLCECVEQLMLTLSPTRRFDFLLETHDKLDDGVIEIVLASVADSVHPEDALAGVRGDWPLYLKLARCNPALLLAPEILDVPELRRAAIEAIRRARPLRWLEAHGFRDDRELVEIAFDQDRDLATDQVLRAWGAGIHIPDVWSHAALRHGDELVAGLNRQETLTRRAVLRTLEGLGVHDARVQEQGPAYWANVVLDAKGNLTPDERLRLSAILFMIAHQRPLAGAEKLLALSLDDLYHAASNDVQSAAWNDLVPSLPGGWDFWSWDRCRRLRAAVCDIFLQGSLDPASFISITRSRKLFRLLVNDLTWRWGGSSFLHLVQKEVERSGKKARRQLSTLLDRST